MPKKIPFYKKKKYIVSAALLVLLAGWLIYAINQPAKVNLTTVKAEKKDLVQEVSVTGNVTPAQSVDLSFEITGKVKEIFADVGDHVASGQKIVSLDDTSLNAQLSQANAALAAAQAQVQQFQAALDSQRANLDNLKKGTRPEEIAISQTAVLNARQSLLDAQNNLKVVQTKADTDLKANYENARAALPAAVETGRTALMVLSDIQGTYFSASDQDRFAIENAKAAAVLELLGASDAGAWIRQFISTLSGGVYGNVQQLNSGNSNDEIEKTLNDAIDALQKVKAALDAVPVYNRLSVTDSGNLNEQKLDVNSQISTLTGFKQTIDLQKATNENLSSTAQSAVNTAQSNLSTAQSDLMLKRAGSTGDQIKAQEEVVHQAEASVNAQRAQVASQYAVIQGVQAQLDKSVLYAPISGLVTKMEAKVGEIVFPSSSAMSNNLTFVSIITDKNYEIETNVAEVDIAKIKVGDISKVTLDAYGEEKMFEAVVTKIDPGEIVIEGVPTYKVTLQFTKDDTAVKPGMTANLDIQTDKREGVIAIPQRAVITKDSEKFVNVVAGTLRGQPVIKEVTVTLGIRGSDGSVEITKGLKEGDEVVVSELP